MHHELNNQRYCLLEARKIYARSLCTGDHRDVAFFIVTKNSGVKKNRNKFEITSARDISSDERVQGRASLGSRRDNVSHIFWCLAMLLSVASCESSSGCASFKEIRV